MHGPFVATEVTRLLALLRRAMPEWKRGTLEQRIQAGCVSVNGVARSTNVELAPGDEVVVTDRPLVALERAMPAGLELLHLDDELIGVAKPPGLLSVSSEQERERTALAIVRDHLSRLGERARLWPVHRLDRETSGVLLFARTLEAQRSVQGRWDRARKQYLAWVEGRLEGEAGVVEAPLWEDEALFVRIGPHPQAKPALTRWRVVERTPRATLVEVELDTGRKHQIRAHLASLGHPIVGDARYGTKGTRLLLHAWRLEVAHPNGSPLALEAPRPRGFVP
jgi:23S rRNA pseudouridine1911/1915/1917 synthase